MRFLSKRSVRALTAVLMAVSLAASLWAEEGYRKPSPAVLDVLHAPPAPFFLLSPAGDSALVGEPILYPDLAVLAEPMLRLAGLRLNPRTNGPHNPFHVASLSVLRLSGGAPVRVALPATTKIGPPQWSADGKRFAFMETLEDGIALWVVDAATAKARRLEGVRINPLLGSGVQWMPDQQTLLVKLVPAGRGPAPAPPRMPLAPRTEESAGEKGPSSTYEARDVLTSVHDEQLFDYYSTSQLARVDAATGKVQPIGKADLHAWVDVAPDGQHLFVETIHRPYSYQHSYNRFAKNVDIWDRSGKLVHTLAKLPLADQVPIHGVATGPRAYSWRPNEPATLLWAEALDGGDFRKPATHRDKLLLLKAPFKGEPKELFKTEHRYVGSQWGEKGGLLLVNEWDQQKRWRRTHVLDADRPETAPRLLWDLSVNERYNNPGSPVTRTLPTGHSAIRQEGAFIYTTGAGASPEGDRPFLDRWDLAGGKAERLFRSEPTAYEFFAGALDPAAGRFVTRRETPNDPPNYHIRELTGPAAGEVKPGEATMTSALRAPLTDRKDPTPQLRGIKKQLVTYKREDGTPLSFTLYLPPGYKEGTRVPAVLWAYPLEYSDATTAGQVAGSTQRFTTISYASHMFFLLEGYAIIDNPSMPVIGHPDTAYDTFVEQLVGNAKAAVDKAVEMGVVDPERVGVGGHSHGGLMTATLTAHSDIFRAGIARSGAYNHTMRPFGFQNERRTLWQAMDTYVKLSPVMHAQKINEPLLIIHGELDVNPGTVPLQSERLYQAVRGTGGTTRLVMLPLESHGYLARQSIEHTLYEMLSWFDRHVKNAPARETRAPAAKSASQ